MTEPAVAIRRLTKVFPIPFTRSKLVALRNLSLEVAPGQIYGLLGPNGSGKSTTLKILLGLVTPTSGSAAIFGRDSRDPRSRQAVGFLPENTYFYKHLTGQETLRFYGKLCGLSEMSLGRRIEELLHRVGLHESRHQRLGTYSKGMLQRIGLAQALIHQPKLVVLDEPTSGLDPGGSRQIREMILELKKSGVTVLLSSHLLSQAQEICDRVGILARGVVVREGKVDDLLALEDRTELILQNATPEVLTTIRTVVACSPSRLLSERKPQTTLERLFLAATGSSFEPE